MDLRQYVLDEVAHDWSEGYLTRREALRRLGLMGLSASAAAALLAACGSSTPVAQPPRATPAGSASPSLRDGTETIRFRGHNVTLIAAWAQAAQPRGAVLVIHEISGLNDQIRSVVARLAGSGYSALAVDLVSEEGGTDAIADPGTVGGYLSQAPESRLVGDVRSALDELQRRAPGLKLGVVGFCFGGSVTWSVLAAGEPRLAAAAPFYGTVPSSPDFSHSRAAVLAVYAGLDDRVTSTRPAAEAALQQAQLVHSVVVYPGVNHGFFNDQSPRYDAAASAQAYAALMDWFGRYLG